MEREKLEIADATTKLTAIEDRRRALARQLEAIRSETEEVSMKVAEFQDRKSTFLPRALIAAHTLNWQATSRIGLRSLGKQIATSPNSLS